MVVLYLGGPFSVFGQHTITATADYDPSAQIISVLQELVYVNQSPDTLHTIILNDWNHAYSNKETALAHRFSDEFVRSFHLSRKHERGHTDILSVHSTQAIRWERLKQQDDIITLFPEKPLLPGETIKVQISYNLKIPDQKFTGYGYGKEGSLRLKNWLLLPALYQETFATYSNLNSEDASIAPFDIDLIFRVPVESMLFTDLNQQQPVASPGPVKEYILSGKSRQDVVIALGKPGSFHAFRSSQAEVVSDIRPGNVGDIQQALIVDRVLQFTANNIGKYPHSRIVVLQSDYDRNPFYGLNQLPAFLSPFEPSFVYEMKILKTYLNNFLRNSMKLDPRKYNYVYDGIQMYWLMKYVEEYYPEMKMMGSISKYRLLKGYNLTNLPFNAQYAYFYLLMARKNLDQPIGYSKDRLIKFNEQIAGKYRAGLSMRYLASYMGETNFENAIRAFYSQSNQTRSDEALLKKLLGEMTDKDFSWFFETVVHSRQLIDFKMKDVETTSDSIRTTIVNKSAAPVPVRLYGVRGKQIVWNKWLEGIEKDSTITVPREGVDRVVLNYMNEAPEFNRRDNAVHFHGNKAVSKPVKFTVMKDLEDPRYTQILYVPTVVYNLYDGISFGLRFHNKTILDKPFVVDLNPVYSSNTQSLIGNFILGLNQYNRDSNLYHIRYNIAGSYFHYAPDAAYFKFTPSVTFRFREENFKDNHKQLLLFRNVFVNQEYYELNPADEETSYNVFNARYVNTNSEATKHLNFITDLQLSDKFGKASVEAEYRKLFTDNRQISIRLFAGAFIYNQTDNDYFSFGLDRPTDYLFDYNFYGRSETTGIFSQQLILADGAFKSRIADPFANQWISTANLGFNIWNWIEVYGDVGFVKNHGRDARFVYDNGVRLNLVTDYFELYFPFYSNNGWEIGKPDYNERIRFVVTIDPRILVNLFTRKWF